MKKLFTQRSTGSPFPPKTKKEIYKNLETSRQQAALSVLKDAEETSLRLSYATGILKLCADPVLRSFGYRTIHFKYHRYFMLYRIESNKVYIDAIYHDLQDYENITK